MATAFLAASTLQAATSVLPDTQNATQFDENVALPYRRAFTPALHTQEALLQRLEQHLEQAAQQAGWPLSSLSDYPIILGSTAYNMAAYEHAYATGSTQTYALTDIATHLQQRYRNQQVISLSTSCTSSALATSYAARMVHQGFAPGAFVVGFEVFNRTTFEHFYAMQLLAQDPKSAPFTNPQGLILGEGMAVLALSAQAPTQSPALRLHSFAHVTDAVSLSNSQPEALATLLTQCMHTSGLAPNALTAIKPQATGGADDAMELRVLQQRFPSLPVITPKQHLGHTLGAAAALETAWLAQRLQNRQLPLQRGVETAPEHGHILHYFLGFGGSQVAWMLSW